LASNIKMNNTKIKTHAKRDILQRAQQSIVSPF
jgi:hypothetical protein